MDYRNERGKMLLSRRNQLLLEFSFWNEPVPRPGPNIYELRSYQLRVTVSDRVHSWAFLHSAWICYSLSDNLFYICHIIIIAARDDDRVGELLVTLFLFLIFHLLSDSHSIIFILLINLRSSFGFFLLVAIVELRLLTAVIIVIISHYHFIGFADCSRWIWVNGTICLRILCMTPKHDSMYRTQFVNPKNNWYIWPIFNICVYLIKLDLCEICLVM